MAHTPTKRSYEALLSLFSYNTTGRIGAYDFQDLIASLFNDLGYGTDYAVTAEELKPLVVAAFTELVKDLSPQLGGELDANGHSIGFVQQESTGTGSTAIDWKLGNKYKFTFGAQNETFTFGAPSKPCNLLLMLIQDSVGSRIATWPSNVKYPNGITPTLSMNPGAVDIISFYYDGSDYYGVSTLNFL